MGQSFSERLVYKVSILSHGLPARHLCACIGLVETTFPKRSRSTSDPAHNGVCAIPGLANFYEEYGALPPTKRSVGEWLRTSPTAKRYTRASRGRQKPIRNDQESKATENHKSK